jgi:hypothetical protein
MSGIAFEFGGPSDAHGNVTLASLLLSQTCMDTLLLSPVVPAAVAGIALVVLLYSTLQAVVSLIAPTVGPNLVAEKPEGESVGDEEPSSSPTGESATESDVEDYEATAVVEDPSARDEEEEQFEHAARDYPVATGNRWWGINE